jgi:hypothetical protein
MASTPTEPLSVGVAPTRQDYARIAAFGARRALGGFGRWASFAPFVAGAAGLIGGFALALAIGAPTPLQLALGGALGYAAAVLISAAVQSASLRRVVRRDGAFLRPFVLEADGEGLVIRSEVTATRIAWAAVHEVSEEGGYVLIWLDAATAVAAPARAFPTTQARDAFVKRLRTLRTAARGSDRKDAVA